MDWDEDDSILKVVGCLWGGEYTLRTYNDFSFETPNFEEFDEVDEDE